MNYWDEYEWLHHVESDEDAVTRGCISVGCSVAALIILMLCAILCGCKSVRYVNVPETHTDTLYISKMQRDSIWLHDSIHVTERQHGDTFYVEVAKWKTKYVERLRTDTLIEHLTDSIAYPVEVEKMVPRQLTLWQKTRMRCGEGSLLLLLLYIIYSVYKFKLNIFI